MKEIQQPFMFLILGERGRMYSGGLKVNCMLCSLLRESLSVQLCGIFTLGDTEDQVSKYV